MQLYLFYTLAGRYSFSGTLNAETLVVFRRQFYWSNYARSVPVSRKCRSFNSVTKLVNYSVSRQMCSGLSHTHKCELNGRLNNNQNNK